MMNRTMDFYTSVDSSDDHRLSTSDLIASRQTDRKLHHSIDATAVSASRIRNSNLFYRVPNNDYMWKNGPIHKISRAKINSYLEDHANSLKHVPCSTKYSKLAAWGHRYSGKFRRSKKISMSEYYMKHSNDTPASNQYKITVKQKIPGNYKSTVQKGSVIDSLMEEKKVIPSPDKYQINLKQIRLRTRITKFFPIKKERFEKIKKDGSPGPTSYESPTCIRKMQWSPPKGSVGYKTTKDGSGLYLDKLIR